MQVGVLQKIWCDQAHSW